MEIPAVANTPYMCVLVETAYNQHGNIPCLRLERHTQHGFRQILTTARKRNEKKKTPAMLAEQLEAAD